MLLLLLLLLLLLPLSCLKNLSSMWNGFLDFP
jgi:hypothetical protein